MKKVSREQRPAFRLPLQGLWMSHGCPWPTALFSRFPNELGIKVNTFGRRGLWWGSCSETGQWLSLGRGAPAKRLRDLSSLSALPWRGVVLAFGRHRCCNHCTLSSGRTGHTLVDLYSKKCWPGTLTHHFALHLKLQNKTCRKK